MPKNPPKDTADLVGALLDKLNIEKVIVVGISAGGLTAIELAANYPEKLIKLILISADTEKWMTDKHKNYKKGKKQFSPTFEKYSWGFFRLMQRLKIQY